MHKISFDLGDDARCYRPSLPALIYFHKCIFNTWATRAFPEYLDSQVPNSPRPKFPFQMFRILLLAVQNP